MCYNCYHTQGRVKRAWKCTHIEKYHYANGFCKTCYHNLYSKKRYRNKKEKENFKEDDDYYKFNFSGIDNFEENIVIDLINDS